MIGNKIKVAYLISSLSKQAPVQVLYDIVENIDFSKYEITIITLKKEAGFSLLDNFKKLPVLIITADTFPKYELVRLFRTVRKSILENKIQIVHSHCFRSLLINTLLKKHVKTFHTIHNYPGHRALPIYGYFRGYFINFLTKILLNKIDYPIACSESVKEELSAKRDIHVASIQNGVKPCARPCLGKYEIKMNLHLNPYMKYLISVGRFSKEKNFIKLVESFQRIKPKGYMLIILGDGLLFNKISRLSDESVILPGFKINVFDYLCASEIYVSTSLTEGLPLSVLEAMSAGLPLVLSDISPHKEIFAKASECEIGELFSNHIENDLDKKLKKIIGKDISQIKKNVERVFSESFTAECMSTKYQRMYCEVLMGR